MSITKADIVEMIYKDAGYSKKEAADLVDLVFKLIKDTLSGGEKVKISGFGNFSIRDKHTRVGRNPQTGDSMEISARRVLTFKPSQVLKEDINERFGHRLVDDGTEDVTLPPKEGIPKALSTYHGHHHDDDDDDDS